MQNYAQSDVETLNEVYWDYIDTELQLSIERHDTIEDAMYAAHISNGGELFDEELPNYVHEDMFDDISF